MIQHYLVRAVGLHRNAPRLYLDCAFLAKTDFQPGATFDVDAEDGGTRIVLRISGTGRRRVSGKSNRRSERTPVIDINNRQDLCGFPVHQPVRVVIRQKEVFVLLAASEVNRRERLNRLIAAAGRHGTLRVGSLAHGIGVMSNAAHAGLRAAGLNPLLALANEIDSQYIEQSCVANPVWDAETRALAAPLQEVVQDRWLAGCLPQVEVLEAGIPCSGASRAGKSKRGLKHMEAHPCVGHLIAPTLMAIQQLQPVTVVVENVSDYAASASADILRSMLRDMAYTVSEVVLDARKFGALEARKRWFLVAVTQGIELDLSSLQGSQPGSTQIVGGYLEPVAENDPAWRPFTYLFDKQARDASKGDCFAMQLVSANDSSVPTLRKGYHKGGSTDPLLMHPTLPGLYRLFTPAEHASFKQVPHQLIEGLSSTIAHQGLGQSVAYEPVRALFETLGRALAAFVSSGGQCTAPVESALTRLVVSG